MYQHKKYSRESYKNTQENKNGKRKKLTFLPLSMYLRATSSPVFLSLANLATAKFPEPSSFNGSYLSSMSTLSLNQNSRKTEKKCTKLDDKNMCKEAKYNINLVMMIMFCNVMCERDRRGTQWKENQKRESGQ